MRKKQNLYRNELHHVNNNLIVTKIVAQLNVRITVEAIQENSLMFHEVIFGKQSSKMCSLLLTYQLLLKSLRDRLRNFTSKL